MKKYWKIFLPVLVVLMILCSFFVIHKAVGFYLSNKVQNQDFSIFDSIKSLQNHVISKFYSPSGEILVYKIEISDENYAKLTENLPDSGQEYVKGEIKLPNGKKEKAKIRIRGGSQWHWEYPKKSWRIKLNDPYNGKTIFNFINPRHKSHVLFPLGYYLGAEAGLLSPDSEFIALYINGEYQGVYDNIEQINDEFLENHGKEYGDIYYGEPENANIKYLDMELGVFSDSRTWQYKPTEDTKNSITDHNSEQLEALLDTIKGGIDSSYKKDIQNLVNMDKMLRFIALQNLIGTQHIDSYHNIKFYLDPGSNKFEPIVWDLFTWVPYKDLFRWITRTDNVFFNQLLRFPEFVEKKNQYLWEFLDSFASIEKINQFLDEKTDQIKYEMFFDPVKDFVDFFMWVGEEHPQKNPSRPLGFVEWLKSIDFINTWYRVNYNHLIDQLSTPKITAYIVRKKDFAVLIFDVTGEVSATIKDSEYGKYTIYCDKDFNFEISPKDEIVGIEPQKLYPGFQEIKNLNLDKNMIRRAMRPVPLRYQYIIGKPVDEEELNVITFINNINGEEFTLNIREINDVNELPGIEESDSVHPWN